jgi:hypothetical protein
MMRVHPFIAGVSLLFAAATTGVAAIGGPAALALASTDTLRDAGQVSDAADPAVVGAQRQHLKLVPPPELTSCMPHADIDVDIKLTTDKKGFDIFDIRARHVLPNRDYTVFLTEHAHGPFGAAEYIGELSTNAQGDGEAEYHLIVGEAFASTVVNDQRVRVDLHQVAVWFADPKDDDVCVGPSDDVTPFDGDGSAGGLAFSSTSPILAPPGTP